MVGRNAAGRDGFCAGCHRYVAVQLDCFDCHATQPAAVADAGIEKPHKANDQPHGVG